MAENNDGWHILETFIKSGLHPNLNDYVMWPKQTITVCLIEYSPDTHNPALILTKWNNPGSYYKNYNDAKHAEKRLIDYINWEEDLAQIKSITIYSNYSPCAKCSCELIELREMVPNLQIKVKFSAFFCIRRPSCAESTCNCNVDEPGAFGMLIELDALPFQEEDWNDLIYLLMRNDELNGRPTLDLDGLRYEYYGDWRNGEDEKMMDDYQILSQYIY